MAPAKRPVQRGKMPENATNSCVQGMPKHPSMWPIRGGHPTLVRGDMRMPELRSKTNARHLSRVLETGAALLRHEDADSPPARLVNGHVSAIKALAGETEAAETVCNAIRARKISPIAPAAQIEGARGSVVETGH